MTQKEYIQDLSAKLEIQGSIAEKLSNTDTKLVEIIQSMVKLSPEDRISANELLNNSYFDEIKSQLEV